MGRLTGLFLLAFVTGIVALQQAAALPAASLACLGAGAGVFALAAATRRRWPPLALACALLGGGLCGWGWAAWRAETRLADSLSPKLEGVDIRIEGQVVSLPVIFGNGQRFEFRVDTATTPDAKWRANAGDGTFPRRLRLSHYTHAGRNAPPARSRPSMRAGERWALTVRLKRPHGTINPGGFDYEAWLLTRGLAATGYIRPGPPPRRLSAFTFADAFGTPLLAVHVLRARLRDIFRRHLRDAPYGGALTALAIGDQQATPDTQWAVFNRTGTTHLMSISGLHVTLIAFLVMAAINRLWRGAPTLCRILSAQQASLVGGSLGAFAYALLAGFGIPAQRTCFMVGIATLALLRGHGSRASRVLLLALSGVLVLDPWAVLAPGFWLSFGAVGALIWIGTRNGGQAPAEETRWRRWRVQWRQGAWNFARAQWAATLATLPVLLWTFQQFPLASPIANLVAIPVISFVVTPLTLLSVLLAWLPTLPLLDLAHAVLALLMRFLETLSAWPLWQPPAPEFRAVVLAACGVFLLLLPRGLAGKGCGAVLVLPILFWPAPRVAPGDLRVTVLDVGQGQAVLLETARHRLLYDTGPRYGFGPEADNAGRRVVLPYLVSRGISILDGVVISHRDQDHAGGFDTLRAGVAMRRIFSPLPPEFGGEPCVRGLAWTWDDVRFEFLHPAPAPGQILKGGNGDSCVLKVGTASGRLLLPGDIDRRAERQLLATARTALSAEAILAPHHGSKGSSSPPFVAAVGPAWALVSAGYRNRFRHPHPETLARYALLGPAAIRRTDRDGALVLTFSRGNIHLAAWREVERRYWRARTAEP
ncbi:MAG: DNA internalization-related competence protein ComEC/Rec2 [Zoogloeaceae bacterium]|nr:DNA internalization-related competence protein ComEC/Rec2 [Zoogloeaceae bacterium]